MNQKLDTTLRAILACIIWGSAFAGAKIGFVYADPLYLSALRFMLAGCILMPIIAIKKIEFWSALKHWKFMLLFALTQTFMQYGLFYWGLDKVPGAISAIIVGGGPLFIALMAHFSLKDDKLNNRKILSIIMGVIGIVFISLTGMKSSGNSDQFAFGVVLLLLSNIVGSYTNIMVVKKKDAVISPYTLTAFANFTGGVMLFLLSLIIEKPKFNVSYPPEFYVALVWLALIPAISFTVWYGLLNREGVKVSELNMWKFVIPVAGSILSWMFLPGEHPTWQSICGILIIASAILLQYFTPQKKK